MVQMVQKVQGLAQLTWLLGKVANDALMVSAASLLR